MEQAGMAGALRRALESLQRQTGIALADVPSWLYRLSFVHANAAADPWIAGKWIQAFRKAEQALRSKARPRAPKGADWSVGTPCDNLPAIPPWAADDNNAQLKMMVALVRMAMGAALEAGIANDALQVCAPGARVEDADGTLARLYSDGFLVATWTSVHAHYVSNIQSGVEEPPFPELSTIPNAANEWDLSDLFARRFCPRQCPKKASPLLHVLMRSTNPGSRGWNSLLESSLAESQAVRLVVSNAVVVAMSTLHPFLHPSLRPPWAMRMRIMRTAQVHLQDVKVKEALSGSAASTKEAVRRMLASTMTAAQAMHAAFVRVGHPVGYLTSPPMAMPACGMEGAMVAFLYAGMRLATDSTGQLKYKHVVNAAFSKHMVRDANEHFIGDPGDEQAGNNVWMQWDAPWLGKGTASVHNKVPLVSVASDLWSMAFRTNFIVFWAHCMTKSMRASRLDSVLHRGIHSMNAVTKLTSALPLEMQLGSQHAALTHPSAGILTIEEAAQLLGIEGVKGTSSNGGSKGAQDALRSLSAAGSEAAARLFNFARAAWVQEELLFVDLGEQTRAMQLKALFQRLGRSGYDAATSVMEDLPLHATHLHACIECRRVANAYCTDNLKAGTTFNELGVSSSMLCTECTGSEKKKTHIRCAKRSSAALRTALNFEEQMIDKEVESLELDETSVCDVLSGHRAYYQNEVLSNANDASCGIAARIRRDAKNTLEQRSMALACGEQPMLRVPILGRAIRVWNEWYALCSFCGCMLRLMPHNRFGTEICCLACDAQMLGHEPVAQTARTRATCRYCGRVDEDRIVSRWKVIKAPLDVAGANKHTPPPLRTVQYCPTHWRSWIAGAHRVLHTRVILSHLAHNAKPIFATADSLRKQTAADLGFEAAATKGRKRRKAGKGAASADGKNGDGDDDDGVGDDDVGIGIAPVSHGDEEGGGEGLFE